MKRKNAFTLIELLAIIVILAIIAVITVPIILNIIENSQKGAVKDSAFGYKDGVNKFYVSKLAQDKDYVIPNKTYTIEELKNMGVSVSGQEPGNNSWVTIENNNITEGCLKFDEYKVNIENGQLSEAIKGNCAQPIPSCPGCVFALYHNTTTKYIKGPTTRNGIGNRTLTQNDFSFADIDYTKDYTKFNKNFFLGVILDENELIERAFACGIRPNGVPFCIEGTLNGSKHYQNVDLLNSEELWNGQCTNKWGDGNIICNDSMAASTTPSGRVQVRGIADSYGDDCDIGTGGSIYCNL